jgi:hypothetical protein
MTFRNSKAVTRIIDYVHFLNNSKTLKPATFHQVKLPLKDSQ